MGVKKEYRLAVGILIVPGILAWSTFMAGGLFRVVVLPDAVIFQNGFGLTYRRVHKESLLEISEAKPTKYGRGLEFRLTRGLPFVTENLGEMTREEIGSAVAGNFGLVRPDATKRRWNLPEK